MSCQGCTRLQGLADKLSAELDKTHDEVRVLERARTKDAKRIGALENQLAAKQKEERRENKWRPAIEDIFDFWRQVCGHPRAKLTDDRFDAVLWQLEFGYEPERIKNAIRGYAREAFVNEKGRKFDDLELICRKKTKNVEVGEAKLTAKPQQQAAAAPAPKRGRLVTWHRCRLCRNELEPSHIAAMQSARMEADAKWCPTFECPGTFKDLEPFQKELPPDRTAPIDRAILTLKYEFGFDRVEWAERFAGDFHQVEYWAVCPLKPSGNSLPMRIRTKNGKPHGAIELACAHGCDREELVEELRRIERKRLAGNFEDQLKAAAA